MKAYKANWEVQGLKGVKVLAPGAIVKLEAEDAKPLVHAGALAPLSDSESEQVPTGNASGSTDEQPVDLSSMSKAQLVEYGQEKLALALDINKKKDELLAAIADAAAK